MPPAGLTIREAREADLPRLQAVREAAFAPVFASFRSLLGDAIYETAQAPGDRAQAELLSACFEASSIWSLYVAEVSNRVAGFVSIRIDAPSGVGEIGLNAVHPDDAGSGIGTALYEFALDRMTEAGLRVATVSTGGDASHIAARRAYSKVGFNAVIPSVWMCCDLQERAASSQSETD
jgi:ribosomal protein S18 acetylase RimI-like enzyme